MALLTPSLDGRSAKRPGGAYRALAIALLIGLLALGSAGSASALVAEVGSTTIGMQPRSTEVGSSKAKWWTFDNAEGHPVVHSSVVYAIYWDPYYLYRYHGDWEHLIDTFLQSAGSESGSLGLFSVDGQYTDKSNARAAYQTTFRGAYTDTTGYPSSECVDPDTFNSEGHEGAKLENVACLTDKQLREELTGFVAKNKLKTGMGTIFDVLTPPGVTVCADAGGPTGHCSDFTWQKKTPLSTEEEPNPESYEHSFCSYHSAITSGEGEGNSATILYAAVPWTAGTLGNVGEQVPAFDCQDGGRDPSAKVPLEPEAEPHQQEPNQLKSRGPDGTYDEGLADLIVNQLAVEQQNLVTNPLLDGWQDEAGYEVTDECRNDFALTLGGSSKLEENTFAGTLYNQVIAGNHYYLNDAFNLAALKQNYPGIGCIPGSRLEPQFTAPNTVNVGDIVGFDASESDITLDAGQGYSAGGAPYNTYPTYTWDFGDGTKTVSTDLPGASKTDEPSTFHSYAYGGTYTVTLIVTDVGGNTAATHQQVNVIGPPPPAPVGSPANPGSGTSGTPSTSPPSANTPSGSKATAPKETPAPSVSERIGSHSLPTVLRQGLMIHYAVNEQVAGDVEVMIAASTAKRLHIHGATAKHLPKGTQRQTVIGSAVLVTTRRGHGTLTIKLAHPIAKALEAMSRLKVTLRIVVRNASRQHPKTRTLISSFDLKG